MKLAGHNICSGCTACSAVCPQNAVFMVPDKEGFAYPQVDESLCVHCGLCESVCPALHPGEARQPLSVYAAKAKDDVLRLDSSSGGVFSLLAKEILRLGGVVFGAAFDHLDWHVYHRQINNEAELTELRGSKYVQSDMGDCFQKVRNCLVAGKEVLFSGTPCQVAGLNKFLLAMKSVSLDKLICLEVVCHAVPSPLAWEKYLENRIAFAYNKGVGGLRYIRRISCRRKNCGWKRFAMSLIFANDMAYLACFDQDPFMQGFLSELYNRPSCNNCLSRELRSCADLTIADYWNVHQRFPDMDDNKGVSLVMATTEKGQRLFARIASAVETRPSDFVHACATNPAIFRSPTPHRKRDRFFRDVERVAFDALVSLCLSPSLIQRARRFVGRGLRKAGVIK